MKFIPILFQTLMVQATLADRKTKTRRLKGLEAINEHPDDWEWKNRKMEKICRLYTDKEANPNPLSVQFILTNKKTGDELKVKCPYGKEGDILWGRETVYPRYVKGGYDGFRMQYPDEHPYKYYADDPKQSTGGNGWKPSIHMPKTACRIFLEITNIRVERLHDISEEDAIAEGVEQLNSGYKSYEIEGAGFYGINKATRSFRTLWCKINGAESYNANPWVWVISFKKIERPVNFI